MLLVPNQAAMLDEESVPSILSAVRGVPTSAVSASRICKPQIPFTAITVAGVTVATTFDCEACTVTVTFMNCGAAVPAKIVTVPVYCPGCGNWVGSTEICNAAGADAEAW